VEVHIDTPLSEAEARASLLKNLSGIGSPYEVPFSPDISIDTTRMTSAEATDFIVNAPIPSTRRGDT
jgi:adenylylsulfate kinase-like enzyme